MQKILFFFVAYQFNLIANYKYRFTLTICTRLSIISGAQVHEFSIILFARTLNMGIYTIQRRADASVQLYCTNTKLHVYFCSLLHLFIQTNLQIINLSLTQKCI